MSPDPRTTQPRRDQVVEIRRETAIEERRPRLELSLSKILAGALAAASAAVAASWLGVAGTVLGAVLASVVVSVGTALYHRPLERSTEVLRQTLPLASDRYRSLDAGTETMVLDPRDEPTDAHAVQETPTASQTVIPPRPASKRRVQWGTVAVSSVLTLVMGFGLLSAVEGLLGHSVSGDGGSTLSRIVQRDSGNGGDQSPTSPDTDTTDDKPTQTGPTDPTTTEPTDPTPTEPTDPAPTEPTPTEPTPTEPTPTEPTSTDPAANDGTTTDGTSTDAPPTDGAATTLGSTSL